MVFVGADEDLIEGGNRHGCKWATSALLWELSMYHFYSFASGFLWFSANSDVASPVANWNALLIGGFAVFPGFHSPVGFSPRRLGRMISTNY